MKDWQAEWIEINNRAIRAQRISLALRITARVLTILCALLLLMIIVNSALSRAAADAAIAPMIMRF